MRKMGFVHLQAQSGYSFMQSILSIEKLVKGAKSKGYKAIALTDYRVMHGAIQFYEQCQKENIKPIIGMKIDIQDPNTQEIYTVITLAKSNVGYESLVKLSSLIAKAENNPLSFEQFSPLNEDLIVIIPAYQNLFGNYLLNKELHKGKDWLENWMPYVNNEDFYLGVQDHGQIEERKVMESVQLLQKEENIKAVALHDVRYLKEEDYLAYDCFQYMREGKHWSYQKDMTLSMHRHMTSLEEMETKFSHWNEVLWETERIAEKCNVHFDFTKQYLPSYPTPDNKEASEYLKELCYMSLPEKYKETERKEAEDRLLYELEVINKMGFSDYFLIVWDFMKFAREQNILTGPGRGSAAGSIVAYLTDITEVDPLKYDLLFERFLNPERVSMPDIDIDFSDYRRDEVIEYVHEKYGQDHVAQIITFGTFAARSLLRELMKTMGIDEQDERFLLKEVSHHAPSLSAALQDSEELLRYVKQSKKLQLLFKIGAKLEGLPRHHSTHAAGVVISQQPLSKLVPTTKGSNNISLTQYPMNDLEKIGLLKMDFLGLRNLSLMEQIVKRIIKHTGKSFSLQDIPFNDSKVFHMLQQGKTTGIFQLESQGMRKVLMDLKPTAFEDIVAVNALYRPGPMDFIPTYINRKHGKEPIAYPHPNLQKILENTYGVLVYQEQIMQIAHEFAGLSLGEADLLRRAVSKKKKEIIDAEKEKFLAGCAKKGYDKQIGEEIYHWIVRFANYGFNKSHAVAYSMISYQLAYLKAHYPEHFFAALLSSVTYDQDKVRQYVKVAKDAGLKILPPSINKSYAFFSVEAKDSIRMALPVLKGIGKNAVEEIMVRRKNAPFRSLFDFCQRVSLKVINRSIIENLILAGCFDELHDNRATLLASIDQALEQGELFGGLDGQGTLFEEEFFLEPTYTEVEPFPPLKQLAYEKEILGMYLSSHPISTYRDKLRALGMVPLSNLKEWKANQKIKAVVALQQIKVIRTKRGDQMAFVTIGDESDEMEGIIFPNLYRESKRWLQEELLVYIEGKLEWRNNHMQVIIQSLTTFDENMLNQSNESYILYIKLLDKEERQQLEFLKRTSEQFPGSTPILVYSEKRKEAYQLASHYNIFTSRECLTAIRNYFGNKNVVLQKKK